MVGLADNGPVTAKGEAVKFLDGFYDVCPHGIKVYVANQGKKVSIFVAENGFIPILEQMSAALMPAVVRSIPSQKFSHHNGNAVFALLKSRWTWLSIRTQA
jgi:DNA-binding beta-propeller fold protein YncE